MGLFDELMKRVLGKPRDIKLPNESGELDPRLPKNIPNTLDVTRGAVKKATKPFGNKY